MKNQWHNFGKYESQVSEYAEDHIDLRIITHVDRIKYEFYYNRIRTQDEMRLLPQWWIGI